MSIWSAILLGFVYGFTEFFPISSSGHLSIINNLFNISTFEGGHMLFNVLLHVSTIAVILIVYWQEIVQMVNEMLSFVNLGPLAGQPREHYPAARLFLMIVMATLPLFLVLPVRNLMKDLYYRNIYIGVAMILTGCILYISEKMTQGRKTEKSITVLDAMMIGLCQCVSTIPGLSRSAITITAGLATGLRVDFAVKFAFLLSLPTAIGSTILSIADATKSSFEWSSVPAYLLGMAASIVAGITAINVMRYISKSGKFGGFGYYCWVMGVLAIILSMIF